MIENQTGLLDHKILSFTVTRSELSGHNTISYIEKKNINKVYHSNAEEFNPFANCS